MKFDFVGGGSVSKPDAFGTTSSVTKFRSDDERQVRSGMGGIHRSSASLRPPCDGTPAASVWPSPRQTPGAHIHQIGLHLTQP